MEDAYGNPASVSVAAGTLQDFVWETPAFRCFYGKEIITISLFINEKIFYVDSKLT